MSKGYWVIAWKSISDPGRGGALCRARHRGDRGERRPRPRGRRTGAILRTGRGSRVVIVEFDSLQRAIDAYEHPAYQATLVHLVGAAERDVRIIEGASS
jgi:hypothetical protein